MKRKPRLEAYRKFKSNLELEEYLDVVQGQKRRLIVEMRSGVNQLEDEQGRRKRIPKEQRLCKICGNAIENEEHVLLQCTIYNDIRKEWKRVIGIENELDPKKALKRMLVTGK